MLCAGDLSSSSCTLSVQARLAEQLLYLEDIVTGLEVCDVDPLTVNVVPVGIRAANRDALCPEVGTFIPLLDSCQHSVLSY